MKNKNIKFKDIRPGKLIWTSSYDSISNKYVLVGIEIIPKETYVITNNVYEYPVIYYKVIYDGRFHPSNEIDANECLHRNMIFLNDWLKTSLYNIGGYFTPKAAINKLKKLNDPNYKPKIDYYDYYSSEF